MEQPLEKAVTETIDYLIKVINGRVRPDAAKSALRELQRRHAAFDLQLIWEEEAFDQSVHYDALLNIPESGTLSLSYCDFRAKPWPLRGVQRWSDKDLLRVNDSVMQVDQAVACMDFIWEESRLVDRLVNACLLQEELEKHPIPISKQELQLAMNSFRKARKLYKAEDTYRWMERKGVSYQSLERLVEGQAMLAKLRDKIAGSRIEEYFEANSSQFDTVAVARILLPDEAGAQELRDRIRSREADFFAAARDRFITASNQQQPTVDLFGTIPRREAPAEIRESLFQSSPNSILGPVREKNGYLVLMVLSIVPAMLDDATREAIKTILFEEWLEERRRSAAIEWLWGNASNTGQDARTDAAVQVG